MEAFSLPQVSVVIPAYTARKYIAETLESPLNQNLRSFEIIVVDDGSGDGTHTVVEEYRDRGVVLLRQPNSGIRAARTRALSVARGQFVALLDSDDLWEPDYLQTMVAFLELAKTALRRACEWRPKWRDRAAQISLAATPGTTRLALRGRS
jgi:glycosyltransferase involved in cell wall biosynthesis